MKSYNQKNRFAGYFQECRKCKALIWHTSMVGVLCPDCVKRTTIEWSPQRKVRKASLRQRQIRTTVYQVMFRSLPLYKQLGKYIRLREMQEESQRKRMLLTPGRRKRKLRLMALKMRIRNSMKVANADSTV